jgi:hypothetical protein
MLFAPTAACAVEGAGRLIEDHQLGEAQKGLNQGDALALPDVEVVTALAHADVVTLRRIYAGQFN